MSKMILSNEQAATIYRAMVELNNIGAHACVTIGDPGDSHIRVNEDRFGHVSVVKSEGPFRVVSRESYLRQSHFQTAYGL
ncbi:hypothetical protein CPT_Maja_072 [Burkholderia phage Maja]|uniref:Uncharacterized protein n=1 Tax=Burkholderia phage Maja TaxID=2767571 RepID=A0A7S6R8B5_9CAUD|nr:hypothetical protein CPT_Maja_072 [Burkholderia phage Maja]